jgi:hypothetical protein
LDEEAEQGDMSVEKKCLRCGADRITSVPGGPFLCARCNREVNGRRANGIADDVPYAELEDEVPYADAEEQPEEQVQKQPNSDPESPAEQTVEPLNESSERLVPAVEALTRAPSVQYLTPAQRTFYALLHATLKHYSSDRYPLVTNILLAVPRLFLCAALGFAMVWVSRWLLDSVSPIVGSWVYFALYFFLVFAFLLGLGLVIGRKEQQISLQRDPEGAARLLHLGFIDTVFAENTPSFWALFGGFAVGVQIATLLYAPGHAGLPSAVDFKEATLLTVDNVCHGIFLYTSELYNLRFGEKVEHSWTSGTVFYAFRLTFDAAFLYFVVAMYRRYTLRGLMKRYPTIGDGDVGELISWIQDACCGEHQWPRMFYDEFLFLMLAAQYLRGDYDLVWQVTSNFPRVRVDSEVRELFLDPADRVMFNCLKELSIGEIIRGRRDEER